MKTDRELLTLAAKAVGIIGDWVENSSDDYYYRIPTTGIKTESGGGIHIWNALTSSGDAMRLVIDLEINIDHYRPSGVVYVGYPLGNNYAKDVSVTYWKDKYAATRRAIVLAAAEIGETK